MTFCLLVLTLMKSVAISIKIVAPSSYVFRQTLNKEYDVPNRQSILKFALMLEIFNKKKHLLVYNLFNDMIH